MARLDTAFDAAGIEPTTAYEILPAGKYRAQIVESEMRVTKNGMGKYLWLMLDILEGPQQGRKVFDQLNLVNANPTTVEIAQRTLSAICHATGKLQVNDSEEGGAGGSVPPVTIPEPPRNPASRTGDLWILGDHRLLCGDSTSHDDVRRLMNGERAVLFATDPPYLVDYDGSNHPTRNKDWSQSYGTTWDDSSQGAELYDGFISAAVAEAIAEDAAWYCWHASRRQAMLEACWEKAGAFVHQQIIWVKDRGVLTRSHYLWKHEPCFMGWRRPNRPPKVAEQTLPSTWALPSFAKDERPDHPTPKPLDAFGIPMRQHVARGGLCYEPFSGSGSQIMAGEANGRRVFAMEISPAYVDVAVERWQAEIGKKAILDGDGRTFAQVRTERLGEIVQDEEAAV